MHWRRALVADAQLLMLAPLRQPGVAGAHAAHLLTTLTSDVTARLHMACAAVPAYLPATPQEAAAQVGRRGSGKLLCAAYLTAVLLRCSREAHFLHTEIDPRTVHLVASAKFSQVAPLTTSETMTANQRTRASCQARPSDGSALLSDGSSRS